MGRHATPWYREDRDAWYVYHNGEQIRLAAGKANRLAAMDAFHRIRVAKPDVTRSGEGLTVRAEAYGCSVRTVGNLRERLVTAGFQAALEHKKRVTPPTLPSGGEWPMDIGVAGR